MERPAADTYKDTSCKSGWACCLDKNNILLRLHHDCLQNLSARKAALSRSDLCHSTRPARSKAFDGHQKFLPAHLLPSDTRESATAHGSSMPTRHRFHCNLRGRSPTGARSDMGPIAAISDFGFGVAVRRYLFQS